MKWLRIAISLSLSLFKSVALYSKQISVPVRVQGIENVKLIAVGVFHNLALQEDGTLWAWGNNEYGQLGTGDTQPRSQPIPVQRLSGLTLGHCIAYPTKATTSMPFYSNNRVVRVRRMREANQEAVLLAMCSKTFTSKVIIFSYVHRVGRTTRAGREGSVVTFVTDNDRSLLKAIEYKLTELWMATHSPFRRFYNDYQDVLPSTSFHSNRIS